MLCSCCIAPVFETLYARTRRLGPSLAVMLAAPALNPAVLAATFLIFPPAIGWLRLCGALALVLFASVALARVAHEPRASESCALDAPSPSLRDLPRAFVASLGVVARRTLPAIVIGIVVAMAFAGWVPLDRLAGTSAVLAVVAVAAIAVPLALPTFGEIPLALALIAAGAPLGAAAALLVAGPTVNLPSLFALARATSWRVAAATAGAVFAVAVAVGVLALML